ncbi:MAG: outer membrane protein assembly factor BamD [Alphaproteobacteria bacterium]
MRTLKPFFAPLGALVLCLAGCDKQEKPYVERSVGELYQEGYQSFQRENFEEAVATFDEVERQHPYSAWAAKAQLLSAYASYKQQKFDQAVSTLDLFISLHPTHPHVAYAYYLRALAYYQDIGPVKRDPKNTVLALSALNEVINRFSETPYALDARLKRDFVLDHLAAKEMEVGRLYQKKYQYMAAMNRFRQVVVEHARSTHVPEALHRLVECSLALGMRGEAQKIAAVLGHNFPSNPWYADSYLLLKGVDLRPEWHKQQETSWLSSWMPNS